MLRAGLLAHLVSLAWALFGFGGGVRRLLVRRNDSAPLADGFVGELFSYSLEWRGGSSLGGRPLLDHLEHSLTPGQFYYLLMGDSQYWFPCTPGNTACHEASDWCVRFNNDRSCGRKQNTWANNAQQKSIKALVAKLRARGLRPKGFIVNGDLTDFGHRDEFEAYKRQFGTRFQAGVRMYPGLGNHDYANNVNDCFDNNCADRMAKEMRDYVKNNLRLELDLREREDSSSGDSILSGSLAYSWDSCARTPNGRFGCLHFVQLHNYPTYETSYESILWQRQWNIRPSMSWLRRDLAAAAAADKPVLINLHKFDGWEDGGKAQLQSLLQASNATVIGIFFAHIHQNYGLHHTSHWCIKGRPVPLLYSGSVPGSKYSLVRLSPFLNGIPELTVLSVKSLSSTEAIPIALPRTC